MHDMMGNHMRCLTWDTGQAAFSRNRMTVYTVVQCPRMKSILAACQMSASVTMQVHRLHSDSCKQCLTDHSCMYLSGAPALM